MKAKGKILRWIVVAAATLILFYRYPILETGLQVVGMLLKAAFIAYLLDTLVRIPVEKLKWGRKRSIIVTLFVLILVIGLIITFVVPGISDSIRSLSLLLRGEQLQEWNTTIREWVAKLGVETLDNIVAEMQNVMTSFLKTLFSGETLSQGFTTLIDFTSSVATNMIALVLGLYMLADKGELLSTISRWSESFMGMERRSFWAKALKKADECFVQYFVGKLLASLVLGILIGIVLAIFQVPNAAIIGTLVGVGNMIPYIGSLIAGLVAVALTVSYGLKEIVIVLIAIFGAQQVDGLLLSPFILSDRVGVRPVWILAAVTAGGYIAGILGIFLSVPAAVFLKWLVDEEAARRRALRPDFAKEEEYEDHQTGRTEG